MGISPKVRGNRLHRDWETVRGLAETWDALEVRTAGNPPEEYELSYRIPGYERLGGEVRRRDEHRLRIYLPADYPLHSPVVTWETPIFHPNVRDGHVCLGVLGQHFQAAVPLAQIVKMLGDMICLRNYCPFGVLDVEARDWVMAHPEAVEAIGGDPVLVKLSKDDMLLHEVSDAGIRFHEEG